MALLTLQSAAPTGTAVTFAAATASTGDTFPPGDHVMVHVKNLSGGSINATVTSPGICSQGFTHDLVVAVAAGATEEIGPLPASRYGDPTTGLAKVTCSSVTTVTVAAVAS